MKKLSIVIPCYRSEHTIAAVVSEIDEALAGAGYSYEIVFVNDGSPDGVWPVIAKLCEARKDLIGINLAKNFGQHSALMAGYRACAGDIVVTMDDDGQTPAFGIPALAAGVENGADVVYGCYESRRDSAFRKLGSKLNNRLLESFIGKPKDVQLTSFFAAKRYIIDEICKYANPYPYIWGLIVRSTGSIANVAIEHRGRASGASGYTLKKLFDLWMNGFTAFSVKPLRLATNFGLVISVVGFAAAIFTIANKILHPEISAGYSSLMAVLLVVGGILMILIGMLGEYIGRMYISMNEAPQYVVKEEIGNRREGAPDAK
ncbi:MAG: glycosyltransferase family 2 protein [Clostridiales Family XIII bacterium]|jgi:undecaprenyl-phosphate 4-deoxy-4-formamido-L-arabinose transferase|nr:glycosyltransferase family 2 protein [Clostridiales Family XIII bacterium]